MPARHDVTLAFTEGRASFRWRLAALLAVIISLLPIIASTPPTAEETRAAVLASQAVVKVESANKALSVEQEIPSYGFFAYPPGSPRQQLNIFFPVIRRVLRGLGAIALVVVPFRIPSTRPMSISERPPRSWPDNARRRDEPWRRVRLPCRGRDDRPPV